MLRTTVQPNKYKLANLYIFSPDAADDAKKAQQLKPSLPLAFMRTGYVTLNIKLKN